VEPLPDPRFDGSHPLPFDAGRPPRRPRKRLRTLIHALLLPATFLTLAFAGGVFWEEAATAEDLARWGTILRPEFHVRMFLAGYPYALWVLLILGAHEMGHYLACRYYRIRATLPFFLPGLPPIGSFGAVIRIRSPIPDRRALFDVAAAGPLAGFAIALPVLLIGFAVAQPVDPSPAAEYGASLGPPLVLQLVAGFLQDTPVRLNHLIGAGWVGMLVTSLNLFPVGQLDGGHAVYAVSPRLHRWFSRGTLVALIGLITYQSAWLHEVPAYLLWFAVLLWMRDRHPRLLHEGGPRLGPLRTCIALLMLAMLLLSFIPRPLQL